MTDVAYFRRPNRPLQFYASLFLIVLYVPILFIPLFSFNSSIYVRFPIEGFTTNWYAQLANRDALWEALGNSLRVGLVVSIISTSLGVLAARAITRNRLPGQSAIVAFIMLPLVVPESTSTSEPIRTVTLPWLAREGPTGSPVAMCQNRTLPWKSPVATSWRGGQT